MGQGHATLPFLKIDMRHWGAPIKGPHKRWLLVRGNLNDVGATNMGGKVGGKMGGKMGGNSLTFVKKI